MYARHLLSDDFLYYVMFCRQDVVAVARVERGGMRVRSDRAAHRPGAAALAAAGARARPRDSQAGRAYLRPAQSYVEVCIRGSYRRLYRVVY
jgi:hypothetical protein